MAGKSGGLLAAGVVVLTLAGAACGYDSSSNPTGPGYGDTTAVAPPRGYAIAAAAGRLAMGSWDLSDGGNLDLAVMDDYLYAEPQELR